ncbi:MAG: DMT family transporter, partial [Burkholderiaceae bacterium]
YAPTALGALVRSAYPTLGTLLAARVLREPSTARTGAALAAGTAGTALTVGAGLGTLPTGVGSGAALALGAAAIYACYITAGARAARGVDSIVTATVVCLSSAVVLTAVGLLRSQAGMPPRFPVSPAGWLDVLAVALLSTVVAVLAFFAGLERLGASRASMLSTLEPLVTIALGAVLLGESLSGWQWLGGALTLSGVLLLVAGAAPREAAAANVAP